MNKLTIAGIFIAFSSFAFGQPLEHFISLAKENHPEIKTQKLQIEAVEKTVNQASAWQDPVLSAGYNVVPNSMERVSASLMQNFSWFGTARHQKEAASAFAKSESYHLLSTEKQIEIEVASVYFQILETEELQKTQKQNAALYDQLETYANHNLSSSRGTMVDVIRAQMAQDDAQTQTEILEQRQKALSQFLNSLTGRDLEEEVQVEPVLMRQPSTRKSVESHPEVKAIGAKILSTNATAQAVQKETMPQFGIGVDYMRMDYMDGKALRNEFMPMVSISLPIYRKKYNAKIAEAEHMAASYEFEKQAVQNKLLREQIQIENRLRETQMEMELYNKQIEKTEQAKTLLLNYYATSGNDFTEVIKLAQEELTYRTKWIETYTEALTLLRQWEYVNDFSSTSNSNENESN